MDTRRCFNCHSLTTYTQTGVKRYKFIRNAERHTSFPLFRTRSHRTPHHQRRAEKHCSRQRQSMKSVPRRQYMTEFFLKRPSNFPSSPLRSSENTGRPKIYGESTSRPPPSNTGGPKVQIVQRTKHHAGVGRRLQPNRNGTASSEGPTLICGRRMIVGLLFRLFWGGDFSTRPPSVSRGSSGGAKLREPGAA